MPLILTPPGQLDGANSDGWDSSGTIPPLHIVDVSTPGSTDVVVPAGVSDVLLECWGAGGNGGDGAAGHSGGGGGGGGYGRFAPGPIGGITLTCFVPAGGSESDVSIGSGGSMVEATSGLNGDNTTDVPAAPGAGNSGDEYTPGGYGRPRVAGVSPPGGGGGAAGNHLRGGESGGFSLPLSDPRQGGQDYGGLPGGGGGNGGVAGGNGANGAPFGGGGGGGGSPFGVGGVGGDGHCRITYRL